MTPKRDGAGTVMFCSACQAEYEEHVAECPDCGTALLPRRSQFSFCDDEPISVPRWLLVQLVLAIPVFNIVMYFFWANSKETNASLRSYCTAALAWMFLIVLALVALGTADNEVGPWLVNFLGRFVR